MSDDPKSLLAQLQAKRASIQPNLSPTGIASIQMGSVKTANSSPNVAMGMPSTADVYRPTVPESMRREFRDTVFDEIIKLIIDQGGTVTVEELTRYWEAAKIMDKLKGIN